MALQHCLRARSLAAEFARIASFAQISALDALEQAAKAGIGNADWSSRAGAGPCALLICGSIQGSSRRLARTCSLRSRWAPAAAIGSCMFPEHQIPHGHDFSFAI